MSRICAQAAAILLAFGVLFAELAPACADGAPAPINLISNPSFETMRGDTPAAWAFYSQPQFLHVSEAGAYHGTRCLLADVPAGTFPYPAAEQWVTITPGVTYELSAWVKVIENRGGAVRLYLNWYDDTHKRISERYAEQRAVTDGWQRLALTMKAPARAVQARVLFPYVAGGIKACVDAVRLHPADEVAPAQVIPDITGLEVRSTTATTIRLGWSSSAHRCEVLYRKSTARKNDWIIDPVTADDEYTIIGLEPETVYYIKVRALPDPILDEQGLPIDAARPVETREIASRTQTLQARLVRKLAQWPPLEDTTAQQEWNTEPKASNIKLWPTSRLGAFSADTTALRLCEYKDSLYVVECHGGGIYLSKLRPADMQPEWDAPKELVPPVKDVPTFQGTPAIAIFRDKLWLMWNRQATGDPKYEITDSRQMLLSYDFATGTLSDPITLDAARPAAGTWEGGLAVWQNQLWLLWLEVWLEGSLQRARIVIAPYVPDTGRGQPIVWEDCPTPCPCAPSLSVFENEMLVLFSDRAALEKTPGHEPLLCARFAGHDFHSVQTLQDLGRNREACGVQAGDSFYVVYKSNTQWMRYGDEYQDIAFTRLGPGGRMVETVWYVDDMKYNASPDIALYKSTLYVTYTKFTHSPDNPRRPAQGLGTYIGKIELP